MIWKLLVCLFLGHDWVYWWNGARRCRRCGVWKGPRRDRWN